MTWFVNSWDAVDMTLWSSELRPSEAGSFCTPLWGASPHRSRSVGETTERPGTWRSGRHARGALWALRAAQTIAAG